MSDKSDLPPMPGRQADVSVGGAQSTSTTKTIDQRYPEVDESSEGFSEGPQTTFIANETLTERPNLLDTDIASRSGNYMFTVGSPGAGKSTFQCYLTRFLLLGRQDKNQPSDFDIEHGVREGSYEVGLTAEWRKVWERNAFPPRTAVGEGAVRELSYVVKPLWGIRRRLQFSFLEVSGEMFRTVSPSSENDSPPHLSPLLYQYLNNPNIKFIVVLMVDPNEARNDQLFFDFLEYLTFHFGKEVSNRLSLLLLISKPELALSKIKQRFPEQRFAETLTSELSILYTKRFLPSTWSKLEGWPIPPFVSRFSLGEIATRENTDKSGYLTTSNEASKFFIKRLDLEDCERIFAHIYHHFTGQRLGLTFWGRAWKWLND